MKIPSRYKAVCFDIDNTLLKTQLDYEALRMTIPRTIAELGVDPSKVTAHGIEAVRQVSRMLAEQGRDVSVQEILAKIADNMCAVEMSTTDLTESFPGTVEMLNELKRRGFRLGILTNGFRRYVEHNLGMFDLRKHFETIVTYDDLQYGQQKPEPAAMFSLAERMGLDPKEILYVGDSVGDYKSATGAGAGFVAVTSGHTDEAGWRSIDENVTVIPCITDLLD